MKKITMAFLMLLMVVGVVMAADEAQVKSQAQSVDQPVAEPVSMTVSGEVSGIGEGTISVIYDRNYDTGTENEIAIFITPTTVINHKKSIKEIQSGDLVSVSYEKDGKGRSTAKSISFVQAASTGAGLVSGAEDVSAAAQPPAETESQQ